MPRCYRCQLCKKDVENIDWLNINWMAEVEPEVHKRVVDLLKLKIGDFALVGACKFCIAEIRLST